MKKISVELHREERIDLSTFHAHYSQIGTYGENTELALDALMKATEHLDNIRVYKHVVTESFENYTDHDWHSQTIKLADRVYRLHIFYENC